MFSKQSAITKEATKGWKARHYLDVKKMFRFLLPFSFFFLFMYVYALIQLCIFFTFFKRCPILFISLFVYKNSRVNSKPSKT